MSDITSVSAKTKIVSKAEEKDASGDVTSPAEYAEVTRTVSYTIPSSLDGMTAKFGGDVVASQAQGALVIALQAFVRRHADKDDATLQGLVDAWKPETRAAVAKKSAEEKVNDLIGGLSADAKKALIAKLKAAA